MPRGRKRKTNDQTDSSADVPSKRPQQPNIIELSALEQLPMSLRLKIIRYVPIAQWGSLETVNRNFQVFIDEAWKSLKKIRIYDELMAPIRGNKFERGPEVPIDIAHRKWTGLSRRATNLVDIGGFPTHMGTGESDYYFIYPTLCRFKKLRRLEMDGDYYFHVERLIRFLAKSPARNRLTHLKITRFRKTGSYRGKTTNRRLADAFANADESNMLQLESLNLERNDRDSHGTILWFDFLQTIDISRLTEFFVLETFVPQRDLLHFFKRATNLKRISFSVSCGYPSKHPRRTITHDANSTGTIRDGNTAILEAIGNLEDLESLTIGASTLGGNVDCGCRRISHAMASLFRQIGERPRRGGKPMFKELALHGYMCGSDLVAPIADYLPDLESLWIDRIDYVDNVTMELVLRSQTKLKKLRLKRVDIANENNGHIRIEDLLQCASTLEYLNINFPNGGFIHGHPNQLAQFRRLKDLQFVARNLTSLDSPIDDSVLSKWADGFGANLITLELGWMSSNILDGLITLDWISSITIDGLSKLLAKSWRLESLQLHGFEISDSFLEILPESCPLITKLRLMDCHGPTTPGFQSILDGCAGLRTLNFEDTLGSGNAWSPWRLRWDKYRRISFL